MNTILLSGYWPNLHYFYYVINSNQIIIEQHDHYQKQSFRNRTQILTANGVLNLIIPVHHSSQKISMKDVIIEYKENWPMKHWRAITSAYKNSPYFEYFETEISEFYKNDEPNLLRYNLNQLDLVLKLLRLKRNIGTSIKFDQSPLDFIDKRFDIHPKISFEKDLIASSTLYKQYYQTFSLKFGFKSNLSILDLLFNEATQATNYLSLTP